MTTASIGILDADLGGLPLAEAIAFRWPRVSVSYVADTAHRPLGERSPRLVRRSTRAGLALLGRRGATVIILAGQTMAALGEADSAGARFSLIDPVRLAAAAAAATSPGGRIGVVASRATVASGAYSRLVRNRRPEAQVHEVAVPLLGPLLDTGREKSPEARMIVKKYLHRLKMRQVDTLILGTSRCESITPLIQRKIGRRVRLIDPSALARAALADLLGPEPPLAPEPASPRLHLLVTDAGPAVAEICRRLLRHPVEPETIRL